MSEKETSLTSQQWLQQWLKKDWKWKYIVNTGDSFSARYAMLQFLLPIITNKAKEFLNFPIIDRQYLFGEKSTDMRGGKSDISFCDRKISNYCLENVMQNFFGDSINSEEAEMVRRMAGFEFCQDGLDGTAHALNYDAHFPDQHNHIACMMSYTFGSKPFCFGLGYPVFKEKPDLFWGSVIPNSPEIYRNGELYLAPKSNQEIILGVNEEDYSEILTNLIGSPTAGSAAMAAWLIAEQSVCVGGVNVFPDPWEANTIIATAMCRSKKVVVTSLSGDPWTHHRGKNFAVWADERYIEHVEVLRLAQDKYYKKILRD